MCGPDVAKRVIGHACGSEVAMCVGQRWPCVWARGVIRGQKRATATRRTRVRGPQPGSHSGIRHVSTHLLPLFAGLEPIRVCWPGVCLLVLHSKWMTSKQTSGPVPGAGQEPRSKPGQGAPPPVSLMLG